MSELIKTAEEYIKKYENLNWKREWINTNPQAKKLRNIYKGLKTGLRRIKLQPEKKIHLDYLKIYLRDFPQEFIKNL